MTSRLSDLLVRIEAGRSFGAAARSTGEGEWGIIKVSAMTWGTFKPDENKIVNDVSRIDPRHEIRAGDVLVSRANTAEYVGAPVLVRHTRPRLLLSDKSLRLVPEPGVDPAYLHAILSAPQTRKRISALATGTKDSMRNISQSALLQLEVPALPPVEEQRRIVDLLEDHLSRLDAADAYLDTARRREAVLHDQLLMSMLSSVSCGDVPLRDALRAGLSNGRSVTTQDGGFPVLRLTALRDGRIDLAERKAGAWTADEAARFLVKKGDFLISRGNGSLRLVGRGGLVVDDPDPLAYPDTLICARPAADKIVPDYLALVWNAPGVRRQIEKAAKTTAGIYKVNQKDLAAIRLPVPALADQVQVVDAVAASREALGRLSGEVGAARARSAALRRSLLAAAFSGRLTGDRKVAGV